MGVKNRKSIVGGILSVVEITSREFDLIKYLTVASAAVDSVYTPWPKSEEFSKCSHCLNTYFTMSSSRHIYYVAREMFPACLLAGVGMGTLTSKEESIFEIIPPILGLKGNLEVALSSRLATVVCVVVYAIVCACVFCGANPDNVAPPAAAALGDLVTVLIISHVNYYFIVHPTLTVTVAVCMISVVLILSISYLLYYSNVNVSGDLLSLIITPNTFKETIIPLTLAIIMSR
ncbi:unnamed protein product [Schistosoma curassoni]|uniref:MgtE domain-containing protein n=1 Tax=Schistosoma curassoni TaxID=6186 RepID=A0A183JFW4_9TREM|nr:unnamed protein product [Schistosoma curassoni]